MVFAALGLCGLEACNLTVLDVSVSPQIRGVKDCHLPRMEPGNKMPSMNQSRFTILIVKNLSKWVLLPIRLSLGLPLVYQDLLKGHRKRISPGHIRKNWRSWSSFSNSIHAVQLRRW